MTTVLSIAWLTISAVAVIVTVWDKFAAKKGIRRVPEATLLWIGFFGGAAAMLITMKCIRHKTRKPKFMVGLPLILVLHVLLIGAALLWYSYSAFLSM